MVIPASNKSIERLPVSSPPAQPCRVCGMLATPDLKWQILGRVCSVHETADPPSRECGLSAPRSPLVRAPCTHLIR